MDTAALEAAVVDQESIGDSCGLLPNSFVSGLSAPSLAREHTLILISHAHAPPLVPAPDLKYDLRSMPNPPKKIRDAYDGRSKRLIDWMLAEPEFVSRRDRFRKDILAEMARRTRSEVRDLGDGGGNFIHDTTKNYVNDAELEVLRVAVSCAMGRHRSVAMVENLARMSWPAWEVEVLHRDVLKKRGNAADSRRKKSRGMRGSPMDEYSDQISE